MIDNFAILVSHGLLAIALWRLAHRDDLDREEPAPPDPPPGPSMRMRRRA